MQGEWLSWLGWLCVCGKFYFTHMLLARENHVFMALAHFQQPSAIPLYYACSEQGERTWHNKSQQAKKRPAHSFRTPLPRAPKPFLRSLHESYGSTTSARLFRQTKARTPRTPSKGGPISMKPSEWLAARLKCLFRGRLKHALLRTRA